jgi:hypothetical protein
MNTPATETLKQPLPPPLDARFENNGTIWLFRPVTQSARDWLAEHCPADGDHQYFGDALAVEHRYVVDLYELARRDGLNVRVH